MIWSIWVHVSTRRFWSSAITLAISPRTSGTFVLSCLGARASAHHQEPSHPPDGHHLYGAHAYGSRWVCA